MSWIDFGLGWRSAWQIEKDVSKVLWFYNNWSRVLACPVSCMTFSQWWGFFKHCPALHSSWRDSSCPFIHGMSWGPLTHVFFLQIKSWSDRLDHTLHLTLSFVLAADHIPSFLLFGFLLDDLQSLKTLPLNVAFLAILSQICRWDPDNLISLPRTVSNAGRNKRPRTLRHSLSWVGLEQKQPFHHGLQGPFPQSGSDLTMNKSWCPLSKSLSLWSQYYRRILPYL